MLGVSAPHGYRFEALSMPGWTTKRHLTLTELAHCIVAAEGDPLVTEWRCAPDVAPINFEEGYADPT